MKRMKSILLAGCMLAAGGLSAVGLTACSTTDYTVGILQLVTHSALDAATQGFRDTLQAKMDEANKTIEFDYQNAQNDTATCTTIANKFVSGGYDLILANATPALQACVNSTTSIPILGTSVTLYGDALGLKDFDDDDPAAATGINVSGTSDRSGCCIARRSPTPNTRSIRWRRISKRRGSRASTTALPIPTTFPQ